MAEPSRLSRADPNGWCTQPYPHAVIVISTVELRLLCCRFPLRTRELCANQSHPSSSPCDSTGCLRMASPYVFASELLGNPTLTLARGLR